MLEILYIFSLYVVLKGITFRFLGWKQMQSHGPHLSPLYLKNSCVSVSQHGYQGRYQTR